MPELPEVETIKHDLENLILHKTFRHIEVRDSFVLRCSLKKFIRHLKGQTIKGIIRRGKALLMSLSNGRHLVVQLMMTGQLIADGKPDKHTRVVFEFTDGDVLLYNDQRRFGQLRIVKDLRQIKYFNILGPEPFDQNFNPDYIRQCCRDRRRPVKNLLLDHTFVAGIGNIYACEILFRCGINPKRLVGRIKAHQAKDLYEKTLEVLQEAIDYRGSSMRNYRDASGQKGEFNRRIRVYAREGRACSGCQSPIKRIIQAGRSTFFCPKCQK
ncbi:MAG: bifunctional DNA-formamidopyrimidine glycosylase/DNA-(apurinic or apyrimidinic site) lyase [Candidatus Omnitrophica bacterium]|nr:bifunctional DNA-formamidopyrimidine glycosylase/DNA-(apurinic or apyrimidinic site) lyase [Candidatus Omnitrophota bacterium]